MSRVLKDFMRVAMMPMVMLMITVVVIVLMAMFVCVAMTVCGRGGRVLT
jgi:hypothetical protein